MADADNGISPTNFKRCHACKRDRPAESFSINRRSKDGLQSHCKECGSAYYQHRRANPLQAREKAPEGTRTCTKCKTNYPATAEFFSPKKDNKVGFFADCRSCRNAYTKERLGGLTPEQREQHLARRRAYSAARPEERRRQQKAWRESNPEKVALLTARKREERRAKKVAQPTHLKKCSTCERTLPRTAEAFGRNRATKDGLACRCLDCSRDYTRARKAAMTPEQRAADKKRVEAWHKVRRAARKAIPKPPKVHSPTKVCSACAGEMARTTEFFTPNRKALDGLFGVCRACCRARDRERRKLNPAPIRAKKRALYEKNAERERERARLFAQTEKGRACAKRAMAKRQEKYWLYDRMSSSIRRYLKFGAQKGGLSQWVKFLPYSMEELERHIERQFTKGMTWEKLRRGLIHLDHIVPIKSFGPVSSPEDPSFQACWAIHNIRPLWARQNQSKGGRRTLLL